MVLGIANQSANKIFQVETKEIKNSFNKDGTYFPLTIAAE